MIIDVYIFERRNEYTRVKILHANNRGPDGSRLEVKSSRLRFVHKFHFSDLSFAASRPAMTNTNGDQHSINGCNKLEFVRAFSITAAAARVFDALRWSRFVF